MVTARGSVEFTDGRRVDVATIPLDYMNWDRWRARQKQSVNPVDAPFTFELFLAYAALQRTHEVAGEESFDAWAASVAVLDLDISTPNPTNTEQSDA